MDQFVTAYILCRSCKSPFPAVAQTKVLEEMYRGALDSGKVAQYQRAVTPTIDAPSSQPHLSGSVGAIGSLGAATSTNVGSTPGSVRGKVLSYNPPSSRSSFSRNNLPLQPSSIASSNTVLNNHSNPFRGNASVSSYSPDITVQGLKSTSSSGNALGGPRAAVSMKTSEFQDQLTTMVMLPRSDLIALTDEIPSDGIIFSRIRPNATTYSHVSGDTLVVYRTADERLRNPERLNLDRRQLDHCPLLEQEQRLRLLNYQNNNIRSISNLENLPNLIFLDLYNNKIGALEGPLSQVRGLRVLMAGKNRISKISNLSALKELDVLDLHSNDIQEVEGLDGLADLRVLNLAGNRISRVDNLSSLTSLTELNLRRNNITHILNLHQLPALQRIFLSHNHIAQYQDIACIFSIANLIELSLDSNPLAERDAMLYRFTVLSYLPNLKHLDLKRVSDDERAQVHNNALNVSVPVLVGERTSDPTQPVEVAAEAGSEDVLPGGLHLANPIADPSDLGASTSADTDLAGGKAIVLSSLPPSPVMHNGLNPHAAVDDESLLGAPLDGGFEVKIGGGLASLARAGRISKAQTVFDIEAVGPDEKVLIASGEKWEQSIPRKLMVGVTEICLLHLRREQIVQKMQTMGLQTVPTIKTVRFLFNDFSSLKQVEFIPLTFANSVEHLVVRDSPINATAESALASFFIAHMPRLLTYNDQSVSSVDRRRADQRWQGLNHVRSKAAKAFQSRVPTNEPFAATRTGDDESPTVDVVEAGDGQVVEASELDVTTRPKPSSLASLLRSTKDYQTGNSTPVAHCTPAPAPQVQSSPWQVRTQNRMVFGSFSKEFDRAVFDIIKQTLKEIHKPM